MTRSRWIALALIVVAAAPLVVATYLYHSGFRPAGQTNEGILLNPIWDGETTNWALPEALRTEDGRLTQWLLVVLDGSEATENLYTGRQTITALGREGERMRQVFLTAEPLPEATRAQLALDYGKLHLATAALPRVLDGLIERGAPEGLRTTGGLVLVDPLGNLVLVYDRSQTGKQLLKDFKRLLKASKIG